eukprot:762507-Hanusia_phi.AAC.2
MKGDGGGRRRRGMEEAVMRKSERGYEERMGKGGRSLGNEMAGRIGRMWSKGIGRLECPRMLIEERGQPPVFPCWFAMQTWLICAMLAGQAAAEHRDL